MNYWFHSNIRKPTVVRQVCIYEGGDTMTDFVIQEALSLGWDPETMDLDEFLEQMESGELFINEDEEF